MKIWIKKSFERNYSGSIAVAAAADYLLNIERWSAAAFGLKKQRRCCWSLVTKITVAALVNNASVPITAYLSACCCSSQIYIAWGLWYFRDFRNIFLPNIGEAKMNVLPSERKTPGTVSFGESGPGYCIMFITMVRWGPDVATFWTKTPNFTQAIHLSWLERLNWGAPGPLVVNLLLIIVLHVYYCTRSCKKKLKLKKQCIFCRWWHFSWGAPAPPGAPFGYACLR